MLSSDSPESKKQKATVRVIEKTVSVPLPIMVTMLFINIGLGVATRAAPSLNLFSLGLPVMIVAGFAVMMVALPSIGARIEWLWLQGFMEIRGQISPAAG